MQQTQLLVLPAQELAVLQSAAEQSPFFAHLLKQLPCFQVAMQHPLPDTVAYVADNALVAVAKVQENTEYPEDWEGLETAATRLAAAYRQLRAQQETALSAGQPKAQPARKDWSVPTTYMERFRSALARMCGAEPPEDICREWLANVSVNEVYRLQDWVGNQPGTPGWAQGIVTIESAMAWADEPTEGVAHEYRD